ncbi:MAG: hypothetical protein VX672_10350, partial [Planctomycetota bacterium]|nr:hypothetical protein [Planctomycetota bacterium]
MTPVLQWIKSHLVVVICSIIIIAAPVASYVVAGGMTEAARSELQDKTSGLRDLRSNRTTTVSLEVPGGEPISVTATPNQKLIDAYRVAVEKIAGQADQVHAAGLQHNRTINRRPRGADDLLPGHFPVPSSRRAFEEMPFKLHEALLLAYADLLKQVGAGMPPPAAEVATRLDRLRVNFISAQRKDSVDQLDDKERAAMRTDLANGRLQAYREAATGEGGGDPIRFYADAADLPIPVKPTGLLPLATMFDWQWQYWICQDILSAFATPNDTADVTTGHMTRLLSLSIQPIGASAAAPAGGGGGMRGGMGGMGGMGMGAAGGGMGGPGRRGGGNAS